MFEEEDRLAIQLKDQFKQYETRVSLAMIPFYIQKLEHINEQIADKQRLQAPKQDLDFLYNTQRDVQQKLTAEKVEVQKMAEDLYSTWTKIDDLRL